MRQEEGIKFRNRNVYPKLNLSHFRRISGLVSTH